jgi:hypothetical protein
MTSMINRWTGISARNFDLQRDYYYVQDFAKFISNRAPRFLQPRTGELFVRRPGSRDVPLVGTRILFSQPRHHDAVHQRVHQQQKRFRLGDFRLPGSSPQHQCQGEREIAIETVMAIDE